ncbi:MAG: DUF1190 domain-containing protein [Alphaproteobacteria bacterium]|jgi:uncharacterized protein YgiB involved in biofilm formation|nr:DUF1190 domain-containing protein [Alphaproteobacteria bacterium]
MKRSITFKMAILGASALTLGSCGESNEEVLTYDSVEACIGAGIQDESTCRAEFDKAKTLHEEVAPRYQTSSSCYGDFGYDRCYRQQTSAGSFWLPFMVGYMLAPRISSAAIYSQPLYRPSSDPSRFYTSGGVGVSTVSRDGRAQVAKSQVSQPRARTRTVARGGFGARSTSSAS